MKPVSKRITSIPESVAEKLKSYVYLYIDPRDDEVFYVGKGQGGRMLAHLDGARNPRVAGRIKDIRKAGVDVRIDILQHGLTPEQAARHEATAIDAYGLRKLSNAVRGLGSRESGRLPLLDLLHLYQEREVDIDVPSILICINRTYRSSMSALDLYEATRGCWRINPENACKARYALAVYDRSVLEAYEMSLDGKGRSIWHRAGSTLYFTRAEEIRGRWLEGRWEFVGRPVTGPLRRKLIGRLPNSLLPRGSQNPIRYAGL
jgi:hypothetical protein